MKIIVCIYAHCQMLRISRDATITAISLIFFLNSYIYVTLMYTYEFITIWKWSLCAAVMCTDLLDFRIYVNTLSHSCRHTKFIYIQNRKENSFKMQMSSKQLSFSRLFHFSPSLCIERNSAKKEKEEDDEEEEEEKEAENPSENFNIKLDELWIAIKSKRMWAIVRQSFYEHRIMVTQSQEKHPKSVYVCGHIDSMVGKRQKPCLFVFAIELGRQCVNFAVKVLLLLYISSRQRFVAHWTLSILISVDICILFWAIEYSFLEKKKTKFETEMLAKREREKEIQNTNIHF